MIQFPSISEYEVAIKKNGIGVLNLPEQFEFIPNRTVPIKFFNFGSGAFAGVFKIRNTSNTKIYALRCFLNSGNIENIKRAVKISDYIQTISDPWVCKSKVYQSGITVKGNIFPVILMEWTSGKKINDYVSSIIADNKKIFNLQNKLLELNKSLELKGIAHGDIQSGNLLIEEYNNDVVLKLVDYDAMFIPTLTGEQGLETGHSSFQHPKRTKSFFNEKIDRFSFWLIITALEAIKFDKTLWNKDLRGGFNDEDNFLFKSKDLTNPHTSILVNRLRSLNQKSLNYYLDNLFSRPDSPVRDSVKLFVDDEDKKQQQNYTYQQNQGPAKNETESDKYVIESIPTGAQVYLINAYAKTLIGATPLQLDFKDFKHKQINVTLDRQEKIFYLNTIEKKIKIDFTLTKSRPKEYGLYLNGQLQYLTFSQFIDEIKNGKKFISVFIEGKEVSIDTVEELRSAIVQHQPRNENPPNKEVFQPVQKSSDKDYTLIYVLIAAIIIGACIWIYNSDKRYKPADENFDDTSVSTVDTAAAPIDSSYIADTDTSTISSNLSVATDTVYVSNSSENHRADYYRRQLDEYCLSLSFDNYENLLTFYSPVVKRFINYKTPHTASEIVKGHYDYHLLYPFHKYEVVDAEIIKSNEDAVQVLCNIKTEIKKNENDPWKTFYLKYVYTFDKETNKINDVLKL